MSLLNGVILGISDSRPPGRSLSNDEAALLLKSFNLPPDNTSDFYGLEGQYLFFRKGDTYLRCYQPEYTKCLSISTELQDRLAYNNLAPAVYEEIVNEEKYIVVSKLESHIDKKNINHNLLNLTIKNLHSKLSLIMTEWKKGAEQVEETCEIMRLMMVKHSEILFSTYEIDASIIDDYLEVFKEIGNRYDYGHGDMHPGNIMQGKNHYLFIDFESVFHSRGASFLDFINLIRFNVDVFEHNVAMKKEKYHVKKILNYLYVKNAIVINYLESIGKYVPSSEREKFLQKISKR